MVRRALVVALAGGLLGLTPAAVDAQQGSISGSIVQAGSTRPLVGAQISIPGTGIGALASGNGRYTLSNIPPGEVVVRVQMIGFGTQERTVVVRADDALVLDFQLTSQALDLDAIVVTGTAGGAQRRAVANVVGTLNVDQSLQNSAPASLQQLLAGQVSGVGVNIGGGNIGTGGSIQIRGAGTVALNSNPLIYVDGVRVDNSVSGPQSGTPTSRLNDINPEDIERIEVIKGPAAATLYGTEASNGVIQIITKKGTLGSAPTLDLTVRQGANWFQNPGGRLPTNYGLRDGQIISQNLYAEEEAAGRPMFRTGHIQGYSLNVRGGREDLSYFLSGNHEQEEGFLPNNAVTRTSVRSNLQLQVSETFDLSSDVGIVTSNTQVAPDGLGGNYGLFAMILWGSPLTREGAQRGFMVGPPEAQEVIDFREELNRATASVTARHNPTDWFDQRLVVGFDLSNARNALFWPQRAQPAYAGFSSGRKQVDQARTVNYTFDYGASVSRDLTPAWSSATSAGVQYFTRTSQFANALGTQLPTPSVSTVSAAAIRTATEDFVENKTLGVFAQQTVGYRNQLYLTAALRADGNSAFGEEFSAAYYPKLSGSWVISDADFFEVRNVESLRLRTAWGRSGLQPDAFAATRTFDPITGAGDQPAVTPGNVGNPDLRPEVGQEIEMGLDAAFADNRISLELTHYRQMTKDALLMERVPPSLGFSGARFVNAGTVSNRGWEVMLGTVPIQTSSVRLDITGTFSHNRNRLEDTGGRPPIQADTRGRWQHRVGYPLGGTWSKYIANAEWGPNNQLVNITCKGPEEEDFRPMPCAQAPHHYTGPAGPVRQGSLVNTLTLGNQLTINALWVYVGNSRRFSTTTWQRDRTSRNSLRAQEFLLGTLDPILAAEIQVFDIEHPWMEREDFVRLRDLSVSYNLPRSLVEGMGVARASLTLTGRNLWTPWVHPTFSDPSLDPETKRDRSTANLRFQRWEQTQAPMPASVLTTIRVTF